MKFYHNEMQLEVPESVYYPEEDSLLLAEFLEKTDLRGKSVLEVGCGSGLLSIVAAKKGASVTAVDINEIAVETARTNVAANGIEIDLYVSDIFSNVNGVFDLIIFNPPYLPVEEGEKDLTYAGGSTGRDTIERFVAEAKNHLNQGGKILLLISSLTGEKDVIELFEKRGMLTKIISRKKIPWEELIVIEARQEL